MKEFTKYEKYLFKAQAVKSIGEDIGYRIKNARADEEYYENCIDERIKERKEDPDFQPDDDWSIHSYYENIAKDQAEIGLWLKCLKLLDKEMGE